MATKLITLAEARRRLLALAEPVRIEHVKLIEAAGRWAAAPIRAKRTQPQRDLSAMDGYAIRYADLPGPWKVIGDSSAGLHFEGLVRKGEAVRIFTGAAVPEGADTILVQEDCKRDGNKLSLSGAGPAARGAHVRSAGSDFRKDAILIAEGAPFTAAAIGLLALAGHATLPVRRKLRVTLISTGDELALPGSAIGPDRIPASNAPMLAALLRDLPAEVHDAGIFADRLPALAKAFAAAKESDIVVTTGGASVGDHDLVRPALEMSGATLDFWRVAMRPGKPVLAGKLGNSIVLGLPGNPVSAYVTAILFLRPLIAHLCGATDPLPAYRSAVLAEDLPANGGRLDHLRADWREGCVKPVGRNDSAMLASLAAANALIVREPDALAARQGETVEIIAL